MEPAGYQFFTMQILEHFTASPIDIKIQKLAELKQLDFYVARLVKYPKMLQLVQNWYPAGFIFSYFARWW